MMDGSRLTQAWDEHQDANGPQNQADYCDRAVSVRSSLPRRCAAERSKMLHSVVQGGVDAVLNLDRVQQFVDQVEQLLSSADVPQSVKEDTEAALSEVKQAAAAHPHESGKLRPALRRVGQAVTPLGGSFTKDRG